MSITGTDTCKIQTPLKNEELDAISGFATKTYTATPTEGMDANVYAASEVEHDVIAISKVYAARGVPEHAFSAKRIAANGQPEHYLWVVNTSAERQLGWLACYKVQNDRYSPISISRPVSPYDADAKLKRHAIEFEIERKDLGGSLTEADKGWVEVTAKSILAETEYVYSPAQELVPAHTQQSGQLVDMHLSFGEIADSVDGEIFTPLKILGATALHEGTYATEAKLAA